MIEALINFHFLRPWCLLLLFVPLFLYRYFFSGYKSVSAWENVCDRNLLNFLLIKGSSKQRSFIGYMLFAGLCGAIISLSGPSWSKKNIPAYVPSNPVMLLLNMSSDMDNGDVTPDRLSRAKFAIKDFLQNLKTQAGLIVYSNEPYLITPISEDRNIIINLLPAVQRDIMPENGDRLNRAIDFAVERLKEGEYTQGNIVIFTSDIGQEFNLALEAAIKAKKTGYMVDVVSVRKSPNDKLVMLASKGQGRYLEINQLKAFAESINAEISEDFQQTENEREVWEDGGYYLLFIPLLCCLYFFRRGILVLFFCFILPINAFAGFFTNNNQDAEKAFNSGNYAVAAEKFNQPDWKASALYRQGKYAEAAKYYQTGKDVDALYNRGNALAKSGKIEDAIKIYEEVIKQNPEHKDAKFNLDYLKNQQNKQQSQQQNNKNQDKKDKGKSESQNQQDNSGQSSEQENSAENSQSENADNNQDNAADSSSENEKSAENASENNGTGENKKEDGSESRQQAQSSSDDNRQSDNSSETQIPSGSEADEKDENDAQGTAGQKNDEKGDFDEQRQAREMVYRNIPEDTGGLLRAFIRKEYYKNRYGDK